MMTDTGPVRMSRLEQLLAMAILYEQLKTETRIEEWAKANPKATYWSQPEGDQRMYTIIRDGKVVASSKADTDEDARNQAFNIVFTNEAAASV